MSLQCHALTSSFCKAHLLITLALEIPKLKEGEENLIKQHSAGAINPTSDSDDEQVPTSPVVPAFTTRVICCSVCFR